MDSKLDEIRQRYENLPPWADDAGDVRYLLSEVDRLNEIVDYKKAALWLRKYGKGD